MIVVQDTEKTLAKTLVLELCQPSSRTYSKLNAKTSQGPYDFIGFDPRYVRYGASLPVAV